jgi:hypothetical protein
MIGNHAILKNIGKKINYSISKYGLDCFGCGFRFTATGM